MKTKTRFAAFAVTCCCTLAAHAAQPAAVPLRWTVETSRVQPAQFDCYQGETLSLEAVLTSRGKPFNPGLSAAQIYWQTNGMGSVYWSAPAAVSSNVLSAVWSPTNDVGARVYNCFLGEPGSIYRAAFQLRLRPSPGATPSLLPLPTPTIDFSRVTVLNPPWPSLDTVPPIVSNVVTRQYVEGLGIAAGLTTNDVAAIAYAAIATNATVIAATNAVEANTANIASNAAEIAAIPRIVESTFNPGWAENAANAANAANAVSAGVAQFADSIFDGEKAYGPSDIAAIEFAATNAEVQASVNAVAISAETTRATAAETALQSQIDLFKSFTAVVTNALPAAGEDGCIYLVPIDGTDNKAEWLWVHEPTDHWEKIGTTAIDMAEYAKNAAVTAEAATREAADTAHAAALADHSTQLAQVSRELADKAPASLTNTVNAWQTYWDGDDVRVTITNYYGSADLPRLYIEQRTNEVASATNHYRVVWDETTRLAPITNAVASNAIAIAALDAAKADRAWGNYDSHTGALAPAGVASVSASGVVLGAGMAYQGYATNAGEMWLLTANEPQTVTVSTNGLFCIYDADGNAMIEIVKGDKRTVPASVAAVQKTADTFEITYNVVSATHPLIEVCDDLVAADWRAEGEAGFPCAVTWRGGSGAWVCDLAVGDMPQIFVRGSYEVGGESYVKLMGERPAPASLTPRVDALEDALGEISAALDAILEGH